MGPSHRDQLDRSGDLLGHSGQRIGGNDFDIRLTVEGMMPLLGMHETLKTGKPLPHPLFWDAAAINDVSAQSRFYSLDTARQLQDLQLDSQPGSKLPRLASLRAHKLSHQLVWRAEQGKIALSDHEHNHQTLNRAGKGWRRHSPAPSWPVLPPLAGEDWRADGRGYPGGRRAA